MSPPLPPGAPPRIGMPHWPEPLWHEPAWRTPPSRAGRAPHAGMRARMEELLRRLGDPQEKLPPTLHIAGTNGKGSTLAFLRAFLTAAGLRAHAYTSPHLHRFEERIRLAGEEIAPEALHALLERARRACGDDLRMKFFEGTTAAAFLAFAETAADMLLVETGMGGREDPTVLLPRAKATILTPIALDHVDFLGPELEDIALHKCGILKPGTPCVVGPQTPRALAVIEAEAARLGVPLLIFGRHWAAARLRREDDALLRYEDAHGEVFLPAPALPGAHQAVNAGMAIAALSLLEEIEVPGEAVVEGLRRVQWPARLERIRSGQAAASLPAGWTLWMDGGHNAHGAEAIAAHLASDWTDQPVHLIFGTTRGKDLAPMLAPLLALAESAVAVPVRAEPKSHAAAEIAMAARAAGGSMREAGSVAEAVEMILARHAAPGRILVFGSLYLRIEIIA